MTETSGLMPAGLAICEEYEGFFDTWLAKTGKLSREEQIKQAKEMTDCISGTTYATVVNSGIAGFFDRYPRIPYGRMCAYNWKNPPLSLAK